MTGALDALCAKAGVITRYRDQTDTDRIAPPETRRAILQALGYAAADEAQAQETLDRLRRDEAERPLGPWRVIPAGEAAVLTLDRPAAGWRLLQEDGCELTGRATQDGGAIELPALSLGLHELTVDTWTTTLICAPARLPLPPLGWGVTAPLYALGSDRRAGLGSFADLEAAVGAMARLGAGFLGVNPVHAGFPGDAEAFSPYAPSSRRRFNTALIETRETPPLPSAGGKPAKENPADEGGMVDYARALPALRAAQEADFRSFVQAEAADPAAARGFAAFLAAEGEGLRRFAVHQALSDVHGCYWRDWPEALRDPESTEVADFARANPEAVRFHAWLQFQAESQLGQVAAAARSAGMAHGLYLDLAVGTHPSGAETWADQALFSPGVSLGAPPDPFSRDGQTWGLAPFSPSELVRRGFRPLAETLRKQLAFAGVLRIDHILGFERAFWIPEGGLPGAYVKMPREAMLAVVRMEVARAGAYVVGEDLGNIPDGLREALASSGIMGCRLVMFEMTADDAKGRPGFVPAGDYAPAALASFSTHDLPTYLGWQQGLDIGWRARLGHMEPEAAEAALARRREEARAFLAVSDAGGDAGETAVERFLARTPSRLVALQLEDMLGLSEQANLPGTVHEHPNWRRRIPCPAAELDRHPGVRRAARIMQNTERKG